MPLIHAYRRKEALQIDTGTLVVSFGWNDVGALVADVTDEAALAVLLNIPEAFVLYDEPVDADGSPDSDEPPEPATYLLTNGDSILDLGTLDNAALKEFAKTNGVALQSRWNGDKIRQAIIDQLTAQ